MNKSRDFIRLLFWLGVGALVVYALFLYLGIVGL